MEKDGTSERVILQLRRAVLRGVSPLLWRRLLVPSGITIAQLHDVLQVAFGWEDMHLHRFEIRGREYGLSRQGGVFFDTDARKVRIGDLKLRRMERFTYEYDFCDSWIHDIRIEATLPIDPAKRYPVCAAGKYSGGRLTARSAIASRITLSFSCWRCDRLPPHFGCENPRFLVTASHVRAIAAKHQ